MAARHASGQGATRTGAHLEQPRSAPRRTTRRSAAKSPRSRIGIALGVVAAIPVAIISPPPSVLTAVGIIAFIIALTQAKTYWLMYGLYTFSLVLLLSAPGKVGFEAEERGVQTLVGIGLLVVAPALGHALGTREAKRHPQPNSRPADHPAQATNPIPTRIACGQRVHSTVHTPMRDRRVLHLVRSGTRRA